MLALVLELNAPILGYFSDSLLSILVLDDYVIGFGLRTYPRICYPLVVFRSIFNVIISHFAS